MNKVQIGKYFPLLLRVDNIFPIHHKRKEFEKHPKKLEEILAEGAEKAKKVASQTLREAKEAMGLL